MVDDNNVQLCLIPIHVMDNVPSNPFQCAIEIRAKLLF